MASIVKLSFLLGNCPTAGLDHAREEKREREREIGKGSGIPVTHDASRPMRPIRREQIGS